MLFQNTKRVHGQRKMNILLGTREEGGGGRSQGCENTMCHYASEHICQASSMLLCYARRRVLLWMDGWMDGWMTW